MCKEVSRVEWSGVLFYDTEGVFGTDSFKCIAQELFLMDIGTSGYTEYTYGQEVVQYMMKNKHLLKMKKGHIHSHNSMAVFFSGTDTDEILGNSEFHNIYLSLIVNNANDMVAKIAFRAVQKSASIEFKNDKGEVVSETVETEVPHVFIYNCNIKKPEIDPSTDEQMQSIKDFKIKELIAEKAKSSRGSSYSFFPETSKTWKKSKGLSGSNVPKDLYVFVRTLIAQNADTDRNSVMQVLSDLVEDSETKGEAFMEEYYESVRRSVPNFYRDVYWSDYKLKNLKSVVADAMEVLENYRAQFPVLVKELRRALSFYTYKYNNGPNYSSEGAD